MLKRGGLWIEKNPPRTMTNPISATKGYIQDPNGPLKNPKELERDGLGNLKDHPRD